MQGYKSQVLLNLTPIMVYTQYLSMLLQTLSFTGFTFYLFGGGLLDRFTARLSWTSGVDSALIVLRMVSGTIPLRPLAPVSPHLA